MHTHRNITEISRFFQVYQRQKMTLQATKKRQATKRQNKRKAFKILSKEDIYENIKSDKMEQKNRVLVYFFINSKQMEKKTIIQQNHFKKK